MLGIFFEGKHFGVFFFGLTYVLDMFLLADDFFDCACFRFLGPAPAVFLPKSVIPPAFFFALFCFVTCTENSKVTQVLRHFVILSLFVTLCQLRTEVTKVGLYAEVFLRALSRVDNIMARILLTGTRYNDLRYE
jgi:hypothetical protein